MPVRLFVWISILFGGLFSGPAAAQEFRVYTKVYDRTSEHSEPVARTLTLFHAGRVYDFIDAADEVIIFEPAQHRFLILNTRHRLLVPVHGNEVNDLLRKARQITEKRIAALQAKPSAAAEATARLLKFQLQPTFQVSFDADRQMLVLSNPHLVYKVRIERVENRRFSAAYRQYADAVSRLNFVLHPRILLPTPRLTLNRHVAEKGAIPLTVDLQLNTRPQVHLRAEHRIHWSLDDKDRALIAQWNSLMKNREIRKITLREYQRALGIQPLSRR